MRSVEEALALILGEARIIGSEEIALDDCYGRILSEDITTDRDYPPFNRSAMDGFALKFSDVARINEFEIIEEVHAGSTAQNKITPGTCIKIMTGAPVPEEADLVIKIEDAEIKNNKVSFRTSGISPWSNISKKGEDAIQGKVVLKKGQICTPEIIGILAVLGKASLNVFCIPKISIISTGNELVPPGTPILPHQIRDSNSFALKGFLKNYNIKPSNYFLIKDDKSEIIKALNSVIDSDIIILSGGVSMGDADFVPEALNECNIRKIFHKVAIKPGKPLWFGNTPGKGVVFGLPGNAISCQVAFKIFIEPYLRKCFAMDSCQSWTLPLNCDRKKKTKLDEYFPCKIINDQETMSLQPLNINGSGDILSILNSHGLAIHKATSENLQKGNKVIFIPWPNFI